MEFTKLSRGIERGDSCGAARVLEGYVQMRLQAGQRQVRHTCFVSPRESCKTRQERCSSWAPRRWAYETLCCPPRWVCGVEGVRRVHPCYQSPRLELGTNAPRSAIRRETWGQGYIKGIGCPVPQHERVGMKSKESGWGDNNQEVWCRVTGEV